MIQECKTKIARSIHAPSKFSYYFFFISSFYFVLLFFFHYCFLLTAALISLVFLFLFLLHIINHYFFCFLYSVCLSYFSFHYIIKKKRSFFIKRWYIYILYLVSVYMRVEWWSCGSDAVCCWRYCFCSFNVLSYTNVSVHLLRQFYSFSGNEISSEVYRIIYLILFSLVYLILVVSWCAFRVVDELSIPI